APITLLYPLDDLLTNPHSPLTGTPQDRFQQLSDLITAIDREHWATHGGELPSPTRFHHTMLITAPPTLHTQIHSLLTHLPPQPTTSP
ncbi:MAG TPA: hypothetical protein VHQ47_14490, partial [Phycisphaerae bacterium]|nr:hypothetical protein [Phycisphaerae bacterium]